MTLTLRTRLHLITLLIGWMLLLGCGEPAVIITEETREIKTYPFSDPNPIPILTKDSRLYPYHSFDGYSHEGKLREWTVIKLENDFIEVTVLPEVGGKVWGAIDKTNGEEFIYRNEVLKFRKIALRGPWTSGGIEFNFGIIGHTPSTATPVDYVTKENDDGSVSVIVGAMDLPSRTHWRVEVRLEEVRSSFETRALWFNPTPHVQPYYNWMTAAAFARDDLEVVFPGNQYLKHSGEVRPWPVDGEGRDLSFYDNNRFEGHKSYHVVGEFSDFFGGYYHDAGYGFGHWAPYEEMPGQKLWLWALSRQGGIWEDLLTDTDSQYIEFQAGRQFVQFSPSDQFNPIKKSSFQSHDTDRWREVWFPLKGTGGMDAASSLAAVKVERHVEDLELKINAFLETDAVVRVSEGEGTLFEKRASFSPGELKTFSVNGIGDSPFVVTVPELGLSYSSDPDSRRLQRPFTTDPAILAAVPEATRLVNEGIESVKQRRYGKAKELFRTALNEHENHPGALKGMADLYFRSGQYEEGLSAVQKQLQLNTYDPETNFMAGNLYRALGHLTDAKESFGWASRSVAYRSAAYSQMSEIALMEKDFEEAERYAEKALKFNTENIAAWQLLALTARQRGEKRVAEDYLAQLLEIDPLHHFSRLEMWLLEPTRQNWVRFKDGIQNEFAHETVLELAIGYHNRGLGGDAAEILQRSKWTDKKPILKTWLAFLQNDASQLTAVEEMSPAFVFPYRRETLPVLRWAAAQNGKWRFAYFHALNLWAKERKDEAVELMDALQNEPDYGPFYLARGSLRKTMGEAGAGSDFVRSLELRPELWQGWLTVIKHFHDRGQWDTALHYSNMAMERFPGNFNVEIAHSRSLLYNGKHGEAATVLESADVLPSELSSSSRQLYEWAVLRTSMDEIRRGNWATAIKTLSIAREWPENLGLGRPFDPDERIHDFLSALCYTALERDDDADRWMKSVSDFTVRHSGSNILRDYLGVLALRHCGEQERADRLFQELSQAETAEAEWILSGRGAEVLNHSFEFRLVSEAVKLAEAR